MIDYEKLQRAHELAKNLNKYYGTVCIDFHWVTFSTHPAHVNYTLTIPTSYGDDESFCYPLLDELIEKLKQLDKPEPKYKEGDVVYVLQEKNYIAERHIKHIQAYKDSWVYTMNSLELYEEDLIYPSRKELIDAQLKYWKSLRDDYSCYVCQKCGGRTAKNLMMLGGNPGCDHEFYEVEF